MKVLRTLAIILITACVVGFISVNWGEPVEVRFWPGSGGDNFLFEWPVGFVALFFYLVGVLPPYLLYLLTKWRMKRRISALETATARLATPAPAAASAEPARPTHPPMAPRSEDRPPEPSNPVDPEPATPPRASPPE